jgi:cell wall assembly regulator SMI1
MKILLLLFFAIVSLPSTDMKTEISVLDKHLREKRMSYYNKLQPPLTESEIVSLETKYHIKLPDDLRELYKWKNGQADSYEAFVNNSMFVPLETVLASNAELTGMIGFDFEIENWWNKDWLPIFENGGGSSICYDLGGVFTNRKGQLVEYWNKDNDRPVISPDLLTMMRALNEYYKSTPPANFDGYFDVTPGLKKYKKKFTVDKPLKK